MKILHTADWHIGNFPGPEKEGINLRSIDTGNCINHLQMVVMTEKPDFIVISGDLFHQARVWADRGLNEVKTAIRALEVISEYAPIIVLRGTPNHDGAEQFAMLKEHFNGNDSVHIITEPQVLKFKGYKMEHQWVNVACLPGFDRGVYRVKFPGLSKEEENQVFTEELGNIVHYLSSERDPTLPSIFISHYTVPGCNTESGQTQFLAQFEPVILPEVIDAAGFDLVALGHIHRPQQVKSCKNTFYSGALNSMNFNDEGQERGFWIHTLNGRSLEKSDFYKTPNREFLTIRLGDAEVFRWNTNGDDSFISAKEVKDKIVRVIYSCSESNAKALNKAILEQYLYECGAFWVSEISPEKISVSVNRNTHDNIDPTTNLIEYLTEKSYTEEAIGKIVEIGTPIINEAIANTKISRLTGVFEPVEISVKNYRNYKEETFNFNDITFCTINGKNGAGKSSLFMDAILDCLYEEPREGDLTGWIRADEKARSGSIAFTFKIGDKTFRVTRTRAKSGKATLNLSEWVGDEWVNRSAEKIKDTQEEIINILGMDSLTFRSCALIMQDQYGLFLQADKESRVSVLSNILGLSMYSDMESISKEALSNCNREINLCKSEISSLSEKTIGADDLEVEICQCNFDIKNKTVEIKALELEKEKQFVICSRLKNEQENAFKLLESINSLENKKAETEANREYYEGIINSSNEILKEEVQIKKEAENHRQLLSKEKDLISVKSVYEIKLEKSESLKRSIAETTLESDRLKLEIDKYCKDISSLEKKINSEDKLRNYYDEWILKKSELNKLNRIWEQYRQLSETVSEAERNFITAKSFYSEKYSEKATQIKNLQSKMELLENANCVDIENASCRFLSDALEAKKTYKTVFDECVLWKQKELEKLERLKRTLETAISDREAIGFDVTLLQKLQIEIERLEEQAVLYQSLSGVKEQLNSSREFLKIIGKSLSEKVELLQKLKREEDSLQNEISLLSNKVTEFDFVKRQIEVSKVWIEKEKSIPVAKEKKESANKRIAEISNDLSLINIELLSKKEQYFKMLKNISNIQNENKKLSDITERLNAEQGIYTELHKKYGSLTEKTEQIKECKNQILGISKKQNLLSENTSILEILKQAFSPDGIPHNIIRSILPVITATANSILGQMTGGRMGMEFRTEKLLKSNNKKEVVTLDIFIEEYGKPPLPYSSKSGGEKVKAALSTILALAETKSTSAGIRLGMLFIDEPPFLDGDGIQAYCDALETIGNRYNDIKIMAITHDPTFKARFPQNLDVIKTDDGSKVVFQ